MRRSINLIIIVLLLCVALPYVRSALAQTSSPYVYRIKAGQCLHQPTIRQLTGFRIQGKQGIVTALHGVVDCKSITAVTDDPNSPYFVDLQIHEVDVERDVALLSSYELDQLSAYDGLYPAPSLDIYENQYFSVVGYPVGVPKQTQSDQALILAEKPLKDLVPYQYQEALRTRNSPNPSISVLQIQIHLLPGHSGAPVFDSAGRVVGIGNGGLEGGYGEIGWLIPITDIEWQSVIAQQYYLDEVKSYDPQLALHFSSTYLAPTAISTPTPVYRPTSTPTQVYRSATASTLGANCGCSANLYDCSDFASQTDAQACYWNCGAQQKGDIHNLDFNSDRLACEEYFTSYQPAVQSTPVSASSAFPTYTPRPTFTPLTVVTYTPTATPIPPTSMPTVERNIGSTYVNSVDGATYVYVPSGEFIMGSTDAQVKSADNLCQTYVSNCDPTWFRNQQPQSTVYLNSYWIMKTEVSNAQYRKFIDAGGYNNSAYWSYEGWLWRGTKTQPKCWNNSNYNHHQQPVICISWYEAEAYSNWLSAMTGLDFGLPTEAEWEKAARGTDGRHFPWGNYWESYRANYCDVNCTNESSDRTGNDSYQYTAPVGSYPSGASPYGALDMAGNVWEWTADWYTENYYYNLSRDNPTGPEIGSRRTARGGAWNHAPYHVRTANRDGGDPGKQVEDVGFRLRLYLDR